MASKKLAFTWSRRVVSTDGSPVVVADRATFTKRKGRGEGPPAEVDLDEGAVLLDTFGGGSADVGVRGDELVVLLPSGDFDDAPAKLAKLRKAIESAKYPEYLVGTFEPNGELVVDDAASEGEPAFVVPWKAGRYTVLEGRYDGDDGGEAQWCRTFLPGTRSTRGAPRRHRRIPCSRSSTASRSPT